MAKRIPLTRGLYALVDDEDYEWLSQWKWYAHRSNSGWYAARMIRPEPGGPQKKLFMHNVISEPSSGEEADHRNRDSLDNRRDNLRNVTRSQNMRNRRTHREGYRGIYADRRKFRAMVRVEGRLRSLGTFATAEEAARAYDDTARTLDEHAMLNFP